MFKPFRSRGNNGTPLASLTLTYEEGGLTYRATGQFTGGEATDWLAQPDQFDDWQLAHYLAQLHQEGWGPTLDDHFILPWDNLHELRRTPEHETSIALLGLPSDWQMVPALGRKLIKLLVVADGTVIQGFPQGAIDDAPPI